PSAAARAASGAPTAPPGAPVRAAEPQRRQTAGPLSPGRFAPGAPPAFQPPPSIIFFLYGLLTNSSVPRLYLAGFVPGFTLASFFMVIVLVACLLSRSKGGIPVETTWADRLRVLPSLIPPLFIFLVVVGSIYAGI